MNYLKLPKNYGLLDFSGKGKRKKIPIGVKNDVWHTYIGNNKAIGKCYCCKRPIHITSFQVGHNKAIAKGGKDHITNLRPICGKCNRSMGIMSIENYKKRHYAKPKKIKTKKKNKRRISNHNIFGVPKIKVPKLF